jgi:hypothetical protein
VLFQFLPAVLIEAVAGGIAPHSMQSIYNVALNFQQRFLPLKHHVNLLAPLLKFLQLSPLLVDYCRFGKQPIPLAAIAVFAGCDEVQYVISPAFRLWVNVVRFEDHIRGLSAAVLARKRIPFKNLEPHHLRHTHF